MEKQYNEICQDLEKKLKYLESNQTQKQVNIDGSNQLNKRNNNNNNDDQNSYDNALMDAIVSEKPNVKWDDISGLMNAKAMLKDAVILPIRFPQIF